MKKAYSLRELAAKTGATLIGNPDYIISGVDTLEEATEKDISFLANPRYMEAMKRSKAGVVCIAPAALDAAAGKNALVTEHPSRTFQVIVELLLCEDDHSGFSGIHPTAVVEKSARIGPNVTIGPYAVIDKDVSIGEGTIIGPHVTIGYGVTIGSHCILHPSVVIREKCILGSRVILQPGAIIGSCGFGYTLDAKGIYIKLEQLGIVVLQDDVEIGANTTIDRSRFKKTIIRRGSKIDNLCQIAHNVEVGEDNVIAAQTGLAGSAKTGKHVALGGQVGVIGHVELEDMVMVATRGGVSKRLKKGGKYRGSPAIPIHEFQRQEVHVRKIEDYVKQIKELEKRVASLEATLGCIN